MNAPLFAMAAAGLSLSAYALWSTPSDAPCPPGGDCASVFARPEARLFGMPNARLGIVFSLAVLVLAALGPAAPEALRIAVFGASVASMAVSVYLLAVLVRRRLRCAVCLAHHAVNAGIFLLLVTGA
jgi:uncharacterized membrane protein